MAGVPKSEDWGKEVVNDVGEIIEHPRLRMVGWTIFWLAIIVAVVAFYLHAERWVVAAMGR